MASPLQFAYRTQKAIGVFDADPVYESLSGFAKPEGNLRCITYSPCGRYFAWATSETVAICDASVGQAISTFQVANVFEIGFSPLGNYLSTWERPAKDDNGDATKNLKIWRSVNDASEPQPLGRFVQKSQNGWNLQYTHDEQFCTRLVTNEVHFYKSDDLSNVHDKLRVEGVTMFALTPGKTNSVAVFIPERKGQPASVRVYNVPHFASPVSQKTFFKGDKVQLKWNQQGSSLIVLAQTDVDKSNKSYYGETTLYILSANGGFDARIALDKEGPIHDVTWSPNSKEFGVIYGYMPAKTTIFNQRAEAKHTFSLAPRNTILFSPNGRFVLVAGFGNLAGQIDVYDLNKDYRKVCTIESGNPSVCEWSPDSRYIMTATTSPRLRVDNGVKLWHVGGGLMYSVDMEELYNVVWRPLDSAAIAASATVDPLVLVPAPHTSAQVYLVTRKTPSKPAGAYRPPGARGASTPLHFKREDEGGAAHIVGNGTSATGAGLGSLGAGGFGRARRQVPGADPVELSADAPAFVPGAEPADGNDTLSKSALKNKKKRGNRKANKDTEGTNGALAGNGNLAPPSGDYRNGSSPERRGANQHARSQSRSNAQGGRNRSNTQRQRDFQQNGSNNGAPVNDAGAAAAAVAAADDPMSPTNNSPIAKKIRSLQKKIRAIEDLEMRHAGGEKLEDTQIKKIGTKSSVLRELDDLEKQ
ncbi:eukaryotic translation initiation factor subunit [Ophiostoma piceae UAMH 11346]|uniref:Eukaryotic translation initiation factor 2A n=1 Tax=Ophiostoma piceae (strain UAMH 11346) TaxID=1262450 RepID=S3BXJ0_OPHP1|nr:eukaryotic translation initiation factor subunit [Ophiostoma piceae UAMH 11346]